MNAIEDFVARYNVIDILIGYMATLGGALALVVMLAFTMTVILSPAAIWSRLRTLHGAARFLLCVVVILAVLAVHVGVGAIVVYYGFGLNDPTAMQQIGIAVLAGLGTLLLCYLFIAWWQRRQGVPSDGIVGLTFDEVVERMRDDSPAEEDGDTVAVDVVSADTAAINYADMPMTPIPVTTKENTQATL